MVQFLVDPVPELRCQLLGLFGMGIDRGINYKIGCVLSVRIADPYDEGAAVQRRAFRIADIADVGIISLGDQEAAAGRLRSAGELRGARFNKVVVKRVLDSYGGGVRGVFPTGAW